MKYLLQSYNPWEEEWVTMREYDDLYEAEQTKDYWEYEDKMDCTRYEDYSYITSYRIVEEV